MEEYMRSGQKEKAGSWEWIFSHFGGPSKGTCP